MYPGANSGANIRYFHIHVQFTASLTNACWVVNINGFENTHKSIIVDIFAHLFDQVSAFGRAKSRVDVHDKKDNL